MENTGLNLQTKLGERWVTVNRNENNKWVVHIRIFKANTLRGDAYWETEVFKTYAKETDARKLAARYN